VGSFGDLGCFSFNGNKIITTGSGGMVVTDSRALAEKVRYLVNQARDSADRYVHSQMGYNYRMDSLSAALGLAQLEQLDDFVQAKRRIAARYRAAFAGLDCLTPHPIQDGVVSNFWLYSVVAAHREQKERWLKGLNRAGIMARGFFLPLHGQPYVRSGLWCFGKKGATMARKGNSDYLSARGINLPSSSDLTEDDQNTVVSNFLKLTDQP
jgi:dTDP-4-amino-4,6-dideoxygalactose transaminase